MKISKAQHSVLISAVRAIHIAKKFDFETWLIKSENVLDPEDSNISDKCREFYRQRFEEAKKDQYYREVYDNYKKQIVYTHTSSQTLRSLEKKGLISIIRDSAGERVGIDQIKINFPVMA